MSIWDDYHSVRFHPATSGRTRMPQSQGGNKQPLAFHRQVFQSFAAWPPVISPFALIITALSQKNHGPPGILLNCPHRFPKQSASLPAFISIIAKYSSRGALPEDFNITRWQADRVLLSCLQRWESLRSDADQSWKIPAASLPPQSPFAIRILAIPMASADDGSYFSYSEGDLLHSHRPPLECRLLFDGPTERETFDWVIIPHRWQLRCLREDKGWCVDNLAGLFYRRSHSGIANCLVTASLPTAL